MDCTSNRQIEKIEPNWTILSPNNLEAALAIQI